MATAPTDPPVEAPAPAPAPAEEKPGEVPPGGYEIGKGSTPDPAAPQPPSEDVMRHLKDVR